MAFHEKPLLIFALHNVELNDRLPVKRRVQVIVAQCSPHDPAVPDEKDIYSSVIGNDVTFNVFEEASRVDVQVERAFGLPFQSPFSLYFPDQINFWHFVAALTQAKVAAGARAKTLKEMEMDVIAGIVSVKLETA
ncbi:hypothetical protein LXA43DRAFT_1095921 [Ganoderma leucocontextum]|nr:hypothetical protein LXA43DRAFT_1095921 [Ganoderma leucocontextum]